MPGLLNLTLTLGFRLEHCDDLGSGLHQFRISQHTYTSRKVLEARADRNQVITGNGATPSLDDAFTLMVPDGVSLPVTLAMAQGSHKWMRVVLDTLFGPNHPTVLEMKEVNV